VTPSAAPTTTSSSPRIGVSYYLTVSEKGQIINSDPPLTKLGDSP
jgi:hypothetical protein